MTRIIIISLLLPLLFSCMVVKQGEVGVKRTMGKVNPTPMEQGARIYNPLSSVVFIMPTNLVNREIRLPLPSREGLTIDSEVSILYRINKRLAPKVFDEIGMNYEQVLIMPVFRSAAADVSSRYYAKDMHSGERSTIEKSIQETMMETLGAKGFIVEKVLLKSINLPADLSRAIEEKLRAEQEAQRMEFIKQRETFEADRLLIAATGEQQAKIAQAEGDKRVAELQAEGQANAIKITAEAQAEANLKLASSLTDEVIRNNQIEAFKALSGSENSKLIITDGKTPFLSLPDKL